MLDLGARLEDKRVIAADFIERTPVLIFIAVTCHAVRSQASAAEARKASIVLCGFL
jgi:hypothetical protein